MFQTRLLTSVCWLFGLSKSEERLYWTSIACDSLIWRVWYVSESLPFGLWEWRLGKINRLF